MGSGDQIDRVCSWFVRSLFALKENRNTDDADATDDHR